MTDWTAEEDAVIRANWLTHSASQISRMLPGRTRAAITGRVTRLEGKMKRGPAPSNVPQLYTPEEDAMILEMVLEGMPRREIASHLPHRTVGSISSRIDTLRHREGLANKAGLPKSNFHQNDEYRAYCRERGTVHLGWPGKSLSEDDMVDLIHRDGGFPVLREVALKHNRFGVLLGSGAVVSTAVFWKAAA